MRTRVLRRPIVFLRVRCSICVRCSILILLIKAVRYSVRSLQHRSFQHTPLYLYKSIFLIFPSIFDRTYLLQEDFFQTHVTTEVHLQAYNFKVTALFELFKIFSILDKVTKSDYNRSISKRRARRAKHKFLHSCSKLSFSLPAFALRFAFVLSWEVPGICERLQ